MRVKTSKILLLVVALSGLALLFLERLNQAPAAASFGIVVAASVLNRLDSRGKEYSFQVKGPGGSEIKVKAGLDK